MQMVIGKIIPLILFVALFIGEFVVLFITMCAHLACLKWKERTYMLIGIHL